MTDDERTVEDEMDYVYLETSIQDFQDTTEADIGMVAFVSGGRLISTGETAIEAIRDAESLFDQKIDPDEVLNTLGEMLGDDAHVTVLTA